MLTLFAASRSLRMSVSEAAERIAVRLVVVAHAAAATAEVQGSAGNGSVLRTAPIEAE